MARLNVSSFFFDDEEVKSTTRPLPRLARVIFRGLRITNEEYLRRYRHWWNGNFPDKTTKEFSQKSTSDRKFLSDPTKLSINLFEHAMRVMGYDIKSISVVLVERLTGEEREFSTNDTVEKLNEYEEKSKDIGLNSIS